MEPQNTESSASTDSISLHMEEFTLEDTYAMLENAIRDVKLEIEQLDTESLNNEKIHSRPMVSPNEINKKQQQVCRSLLEQVIREAPKNYPIPHTSDLKMVVVKGLENEVWNMHNNVEKAKEEIKDIENSITRLENKRESLQKMKEACLAANEIGESKSYEEEIDASHRIFTEIKTELNEVVATLAPNDDVYLRDLLADLTLGYFRGGDAMYVNIESDTLASANFLVLAGVAMYHRNDRNKIRLVDLL